MPWLACRGSSSFLEVEVEVVVEVVVEVEVEVVVEVVVEVEVEVEVEVVVDLARVPSRARGARILFSHSRPP
jgi:hypothetical protein